MTNVVGKRDPSFRERCLGRTRPYVESEYWIVVAYATVFRRDDPPIFAMPDEEESAGVACYDYVGTVEWLACGNEIGCKFLQALLDGKWSVLELQRPLGTHGSRTGNWRLFAITNDGSCAYSATPEDDGDSL